MEHTDDVSNSLGVNCKTGYVINIDMCVCSNIHSKKTLLIAYIHCLVLVVMQFGFVARG